MAKSAFENPQVPPVRFFFFFIACVCGCISTELTAFVCQGLLYHSGYQSHMTDLFISRSGGNNEVIGQIDDE